MLVCACANTVPATISAAAAPNVVRNNDAVFFMRVSMSSGGWKCRRDRHAAPACADWIWPYRFSTEVSLPWIERAARGTVVVGNDDANMTLARSMCIGIDPTTRWSKSISTPPASLPFDEALWPVRTAHKMAARRTRNAAATTDDAGFAASAGLGAPFGPIAWRMSRLAAML